MTTPTGYPKKFRVAWDEPYCFPPTKAMEMTCSTPYTEAQMRKVWDQLRMTVSEVVSEAPVETAA